MNNFETNVIKFIETNIGKYKEIHVSKYLSDKIEQFETFIKFNGEQKLIGDTYVGKLLINNKTIGVFYNILYEYDDIEFKK